MRTRVAIVEDDDIQRRGMSEYLADRADIEVVGILDHYEAMLWDSEWDEVDIALVDAADPNRPTDQFPGVDVVDRIRNRRSSAETRVIVVTGHFFDDAVRRRMREAGADYFYHRPELHKRDALYEAVFHPERAAEGVPGVHNDEALIRLGVGRGSRVNDAVRYASQGANRPAGTQRSRAWNTYRRTFNSVARLQPMNTDGTPPDREQTEPSKTQIERFLDWATRVKGSHSG
jgi:CheY-like chemotaxis protein